MRCFLDAVLQSSSPFMPSLCSQVLEDPLPTRFGCVMRSWNRAHFERSRNDEDRIEILERFCKSLESN
jgi:hypothetical protein